MSRLFDAADAACHQAKSYAAAVPSIPRPESSEPDQLFLSSRPEDRLTAVADPSSLGGESFRLLVSRLNHARKALNVRKVLITSSVTGEGKSLISANLAIALANQGGLRTLLIDADHRHAAVTRLFNGGGKRGMREWLTEGGPVSHFAHRVANLSLWCLPTGKYGSTHEHSLQADKLAEMLAETDNQFDWVIVDAPPITVLADATIWLAATDASLLVARQGITPKKMLRKALTALDSTKLLGVVLNGCEDVSHLYYHFYQIQRAA